MATNYWWKGAKIYELYVDQFADDFKTLATYLDYFEKLGVNCLHILPHYPSPMADDGYDVSDYKNVRSSLGTLDDFASFVSAAHGRGIRVIVDLILNHTSDQHPWFCDAKESRTSPYRDFYLWSDTPDRYKGAVGGLAIRSSERWTYNAATSDYYYATFYPEQPDLNWDNPQVFEAMIEVIDFWADLGVDGFRLDAVPYLVKREGTTCKGLPETHAIVKRIRKHLDEKYASAVILVAEAHQTLEETKQYFGQGDECHMAYHFILMEQMWLAMQQGDLSRVQRTIEASLDIPENCQWAIFLRNHDEISSETLEPADRMALLDFLDAERRYLFGADRTAVRLHSALKGDRQKIEEAFGMLLSAPGAAVMYYGDEIGMENPDPSPETRDSRRYVRGKFDWERARAQMQDPASLWSSVAKLIQRTGAEVVHHEEKDASAA